MFDLELDQPVVFTLIFLDPSNLIETAKKAFVVDAISNSVLGVASVSTSTALVARTVSKGFNHYL